MKKLLILAALLTLPQAAGAGDPQKPVKVFVLAGQSNMEGKAKVSLLEYQARQPATRDLFKHLRRGDKWVEREDVWIKYLGHKGNLTVGYGSPKCIGPELEFGNVVGDHYREQVLLIKTAWGGRSLYRDFRPPSAGLPSAAVLDKLLAAQKKRKPETTFEDVKKPFGASYRAMLEEVNGTLANLKTLFPGYAGQGYEIAGFVWFQGWNDMIDAETTAAYAANLAHLIRDVRKDLKAPKLPFVIGEMGVDGLKANAGVRRFKAAQAAVLEVAEFKGNVALVKTDVFWDTEAEAVFRKGWREHLEEWNKVGSDYPYHYLGSPRTMCRIGRAFGEAMLALRGGDARAGDPAPPTWSPKAAAEYLDGRADWWLSWSGSARGQGTACLSCHTTVPIALARPALGRHLGETTIGAAEKRLLDILKKRVQNWGKIVTTAKADKDPFAPFYSGNRKPSALGTEAVLNALILVNADAIRGKGVLSELTRKALGHLWEQQQENGAWLWLDFGLNPWEKDGAYYGASLAALAVGTAGKDYYDQADVRPKVAALTKYLRSQAQDQPLHHRAVALWASSRLPGVLTEEAAKKLIEELLNAQEADGGWSLSKLGKKASGLGGWKSHGLYPEGVASDGYATGLVVLALKRVGVAADSPRLQKGVAWLTARQKEGAWPANYVNRQRDPHNDIGKFMRDAATAFAVLALTSEG